MIDVVAQCNLSQRLARREICAMAIGKRVRIMSWATSDGRANSFTLDLLADPYWVGSAQPGGIGGRIMNWFAEKTPAGRFCSLIPGLGVKLSDDILAGLTVLSAVGVSPPHDGVR